jgi:hypothetical protein
LPIAIPGFFDKKFSWENSPDWRVTEPLIDQFVTVTENAGAVPMIVIIPSRFQLFPELVRKYPANFNTETVDTDSSVSILSTYLRERHIDCIDLLSEFRKLPLTHQKDLYYTADTHWTEFGHRQVASITARYIREYGLLASTRIKK